MKMTEFDKLTGQILMPLAQRDGFALRNGAIWRRRSQGIIDAVVLDFDVRQGKTFNVMVGFNADCTRGDLLPPDCGLVALRYLGIDGLKEKPHRFACFDSTAARRSLEFVAIAWSSLVGRFDSIERLDNLADIVEPMHADHRARLYVAAGLPQKAVAALEDYIGHLQREPQTVQTRGSIEAARSMISTLG